MIGTNDPWTDWFPMPGQVRTIQIDIDGRRIGTRYPVDVPLVGDAAETLRALLTRVPENPHREWRGMVEKMVDRWRVAAAERAATPADPVDPRLVLRELSTRLPRHAGVAVDVGSVVYWYARHLELPPGCRPGCAARSARWAAPCRTRSRPAGPPGRAGARAARRRRDAAQRPGRADHRGAPLDAVARSAADRAGAEQQGPVRRRRRPVTGGAGFPRCRTPGGPACSGCTASGWTGRTWSDPPGTRCWRPTGLPSWRRWWTRPCRWTRPNRRWPTCAAWWPTGTRPAGCGSG
ncbi:hypothetical protein V2I01_40135 [Micromonospora sp. BRA006-A]|nr:hypothetical protein [Micromonospora sp. BRA006-A]